ncbi:RNA polymerase sigma factor SigM [soil metagenome]
MTASVCQLASESQLAFQPSGRADREQAAAELVRVFGRRMTAVARRFLRCEEDCADAVQDAFLSALRSLEGFEGKSSVGTWLHRILVNSCLLKLRAQSRRRSVPMDDLLPVADETARTGCEEQGLLRLTRQETQDMVRACIERLPKPYRTIILLRDIEELDTIETARRLGIAPGAVKTRLHRARLALRKLLQSLGIGEE